MSEGEELRELAREVVDAGDAYQAARTSENRSRLERAQDRLHAAVVEERGR